MVHKRKSRHTLLHQPSKCNFYTKIPNQLCASMTSNTLLPLASAIASKTAHLTTTSTGTSTTDKVEQKRFCSHHRAQERARQRRRARTAFARAVAWRLASTARSSAAARPRPEIVRRRRAATSSREPVMRTTTTGAPRTRRRLRGRRRACPRGSGVGGGGLRCGAAPPAPCRRCPACRCCLQEGSLDQSWRGEGLGWGRRRGGVSCCDLAFGSFGFFGREVLLGLKKVNAFFNQNQLRCTCHVHVFNFSSIKQRCHLFPFQK